MKTKHAKTNIILKSIKEVYELDRKYVIDNIFSGIIGALLPFVNIYMGKLIINALITRADGRSFLRLVLVTIAANGVLAAANKFLETDTRLRTKILVRNRDMRINEKIINLDYELIEKEETHVRLTELKELDKYDMFGIDREGVYVKDIFKGVFTVITAAVMSTGLFKAEVSVFGISSILQNIIFIALILSAAAISILSAQGVNKKMANLTTDEYMEINIIGEAYLQFLFEYKYGKDIRLYSRRLYNKALQGLAEAAHALYRILLKITIGPKVVSTVCSALSMVVIYCFIGYKAYYRVISIGEVVQYTGAIAQMLSCIILLTTAIGQLINNNYYFEKYFDLLELNTGKYMGTLPVEKRDDNEYTLEMRNVSFKYPGTEKYVLKNINMKLNIGEKLAVVGMNGSGKTTFIKLLARLYDPEEGDILLNGVNIKKYDYNEYLRLFSVVFQDFKLFSFSLGQNVASSVETDELKANYVLGEAGFGKRIKEMPNGLETCLYHDFDENGVEISGGEAQKIAMARALYKDAPFVILDEPTAALDPISEFEIYTKFDEIVKDKTAIYISHRLSSCRFCHDIAVFHEGKIIQRGSHDELVQDKSGKYYELWNAQAQYYKDEEVELLLA